MQKKFKNIEYLKNGNSKQQKSYMILKEINIFNALKEFYPILVGTIPIGIDIDKSDLDIVCKINHQNLKEFKEIVIKKFSKFKNFNLKDTFIDNHVLVINFFVKDIEIEIYASQLDSILTNGYKHMIVEERILKIANKSFKKEIIRLKKAGMKTEPAFARVLKLEGNPYNELLKFESLDDKEIEKILLKLEYIKKRV